MYFDLHCHPSLKSFLTSKDQIDRDDCWKTYRNFIDFAVGNIIDSQASFRQLKQSNTQVAVAALYALEDGLDEIYLVSKIAPLISQLDRDMVSGLDPAHYFTRLLEEVAHLEGSLESDPAGHKFQIISHAGDINPVRTNLVLAVEGAHVLKPTESDDPLVLLEKLKNFRHKILYLTICHFAKNSFCNHAFAMKLVNPAKAPTFFPAGAGLTEEGKAVIRKCYDDISGRRILIDVKHMSLSGRQQFYDWKGSEPSIADLPMLASHVGVTGLSWEAAARRAYYKEVTLLPTLGQVAIKYDRPEGLRLKKLKSHFNPASINLYDEDITAVIASGGLIGLMMDQRQLGVSKKPFEYFAEDDYNRLEAGPRRYRGNETAPEAILPSLATAEEEMDLVADLTSDGLKEFLTLPDLGLGDTVSALKNSVGSRLSSNDGEGKMQVDSEPIQYDRIDHTVVPPDRHRAPRLNKKKRRHLLHLCNNMLHIARVGGSDAWLRMCIGSDFDGLVDAPNNCENATEFRDLEEHLYEMLKELIEASGPGFRERYHLGDLRWQIRRVMYDNGRAFLAKWL